MLFNVLLAAYIASAAALMLVLLFGEAASMRGTVVARAHAFITGGCWEHLYDVVGSCCGDRGLAVYEWCFSFICTIPHPTLQLFYLALIAFGYLLAADAVYYHVKELAEASSFLLPPPPARWSAASALAYACVSLPRSWTLHFYMIPLIVDATLVSFLVVSFADPGAVHAGNVDAYRGAYRCDGIVYTTEKECKTWYAGERAPRGPDGRPGRRRL